MNKTLILLVLLTIFLTSCNTKPEDMTWQDYAVFTGDVSKCDRASFPDVCRAGFAQATGDGSGCSKISDTALRSTCMAYDRGVDAEQKDVEFEDLSKTCKYDSECSAICEGSVAWKQGCNPREGVCIKTFDTDCSKETEKFGSNSFPKTCSAGACVRNNDLIESKKQELLKEKEKLKYEMGESSTRRANLIAAKDEANRNCLGGLSDATVILMNEFATKTAGLLAGGVSAVKDASSRVVSWTTTIPDYINKGLDDMSKAGTPQQKLTLDEYIVLNCKLNNFFGALLDESDAYIDDLIEEARKVDADYDALP